MADITAYNRPSPHATTELALVAATAGGDRFKWRPTGFLVVNNTGGSTCNVTLTTNRDRGITQVYAVPTLKIHIIDLVGQGQSSGGWINATYNQVTGVLVGLMDAAELRS